jgi:hypothetical protein
MDQVNGRRESRALETDSEPPAPVQGAQLSAKNGRIPGLFRTDHRAERGSPTDVLAEGEELSSNPLRAFFNDLGITQIVVDVAWRILNLLQRSPLYHRGSGDCRRPRRPLGAAPSAGGHTLKVVLVYGWRGSLAQTLSSSRSRSSDDRRPRFSPCAARKVSAERRPSSRSRDRKSHSALSFEE